MADDNQCSDHMNALKVILFHTRIFPSFRALTWSIVLMVSAVISWDPYGNVLFVSASACLHVHGLLLAFVFMFVTCI